MDFKKGRASTSGPNSKEEEEQRTATEFMMDVMSRRWYRVCVCTCTTFPIEIHIDQIFSTFLPTWTSSFIASGENPENVFVSARDLKPRKYILDHFWFH